jgi:hypothetical protein
MLKFSMTYRVITICSIALSSAVTPKLTAENPSKPVKTPVLVELFTSEGCSTCPPADALLQKLYDSQPVERAEIIVLGEHVDYWDELGWHDRFSSRQYTDRQNGYGKRFNLQSVYTPEMVVDGAQEFVGNDTRRATRAITQAAQTAKLGLALSTPVFDAGRVSAEVQLVTAGANLPKGDLYAAVVDPVATTDVRNGENGGRQLHHVGVVRSLEKIGSLQDLNGAPLKFSLKTPAEVAPDKERVVVFAQKPGQGAILGVVESARRL